MRKIIRMNVISVLIVLFLFILINITSCDSKPFQYTFRQDRSCIEKVEICPFEYSGKKIKEPLASFIGDDIDRILEDISSLECRQLSGLDSPRYIGDLIICIYYLDGEKEVIGTVNCGWVTPDGDWHIKSWYFKSEDLNVVFKKYVDADALAKIHWNSYQNG